MPVTEAARLLGHDGTGALRKRLRAGTLRGVAPYGEGNATREWMASRTQVEAEALNRGRLTAPPAEAATTLGDLRLEMLQGALSEAQRAQLTQAEDLIDELRSRLAEKDARIAQLERQLAAYARSVADVLAVSAT
jgi:septal ring factor EnvC (AmiA/AmiB activator)